MQVANPRARCWVCDLDVKSITNLAMQSSVRNLMRFGAIFGRICVGDRVGDYAHCMARVMGVIFKRVELMHLL